MNKVVFLDRDGTINIDFGYVHEKDKLKFLPGLLDALKRIQNRGYKLIIVTNQSGIGRKVFTREQYEDFTSYMLEKMKAEGVEIERVYTCPHIDEDGCDCRKPKIGMFEEAIRDYDVDVKESFAVGDRIRDLKLCEKYPVQGVLLDADIEFKNTDDVNSTNTIEGDMVTLSSWKEIADYICD